MPLFVPILRLAMLFLNVYDSYKTLKYPPPSSRRNDGLPSVRAMTQRKRDMKGCLAVWIVWCCFSVYERFGESIVSLFVPFYDEFKSIVLLFLILTRARGAEPIYLHVIRPLLKPYTSTLDASLELLLMLGDFIFALSVFPLKLGMELWEKGIRFDSWYYYDTGLMDTETESDTTQTDVSSEPPPVPPKERIIPQSQRASPNSKPDDIKFPRKVVRRPASDDINSTNTIRPIASSSRTRQPIPKQDVEPNFYSSSASSTPSLPRQKLKGRQHEVWHPPPSAYAGDDEHVQPQANDTLSTMTTTASLIELDVQVAMEKQKIEDVQLTEEWRQYPAFPSAYPPTPLVSSSRLVSTRGGLTTTTTSTNMYPTIINEEDLRTAEEWRQYPAFPSAYPPTPLVVSSPRLHEGNHQTQTVVEEGEEEDEEEQTRDATGPEQDFRRSLLPLREPLNPGFASDSSDSYRSYGIQRDFLRHHTFSAVPATSEDSSSAMHSDEDVEIYSDVDDDEEEEEEEDDFNMTLQTPFHPPLSLGLGPVVPRHQRLVSLTSTLASVSTALTTLHDGSLRTRSSGEETDEMEDDDVGKDDDARKDDDTGRDDDTTKENTTTSPSVLGKKRALQRDMGNVVKRVQGTESPRGKNNGTKKRRVSTSLSPVRKSESGLTSPTAVEDENTQSSSASEPRQPQRTPTPTKPKSGVRTRRRRTPLSPSRVNATRSPLRVNTALSPSRVNATRSPSRLNVTRSPSRLNATRSPSRLNTSLSPSRGNATRSPLRVNTTRAVRPRVTRYASPPPLPMALASMGGMSTGTGTTTGTRTAGTVPEKQATRSSRPPAPVAQRFSQRLRSGGSVAQTRNQDGGGGGVGGVPVASETPSVDAAPREPGSRESAVDHQAGNAAGSSRK